jgi:hypothetical protein
MMTVLRCAGEESSWREVMIGARLHLAGRDQESVSE